ncbi:MAG TPA: CHAT domain-containing tetratricopeptide repeat protein [Candidatus Angelobacter sp.]
MPWKHARLTLRIATLVMVLAIAGAAQSKLQRASALQQQGKLSEARDLFHQAADEFRQSGDQANLAIALGEAGYISMQLGDYSGAIRDVEQAIQLRQTVKQDAWLSQDFNTIGLAYQNMGNYPAALENYQQALKFDRLLKNAEGEVNRLNNIGNIYYYQGRYSTALETYEAADRIVNANSGQAWKAGSWKLTTGNMAAVYQRLGLEEQALTLYQQISRSSGELPANESAQLLVNEGVLYRRMGDPVKALDAYHNAQGMFRNARLSDGEIRAWQNIGIVKAMDLGDLSGALKAFATALQLSQQSSNSRGITLANLYTGELLRRLSQYKEATSHLKVALETAQKSGMVEEQWKSLYGLGRIAEQTGSAQTAIEDYKKAISIIESVRAGLRAAPLRTDFLADKRDVYDSLIAFVARQPNASADELFRWMERSRARTLQDRVAARTPLNETSVPLVQSHLPPDTLLVEFWMANQDSAAVWITASESGIVHYPDAASIRAILGQFLAAVQMDGEQWKQSSRELGSRILAGIPVRKHLIIVPDAPLDIPFELLSIPGGSLLIEHSDVSYLPSARLVAMARPSARSWLFPWNRQLVAIGDPPVYSKDVFADELWQPLPSSADEVRGIAKAIPGRAEIHLGADARKIYLLDQRLEGVPLLHLSTHAFVDLEHPERSRILLASNSQNSADYLFQQEVNNLDLKNVGLVTVSACDTARGKIVAGEGAQAFSQSFLAAGASATITSMWKVADEPTATFMAQLYYSLGHGATKAESLQAAKLHFLRSKSALASPRYWAAFVINGDGWNPTVRVIPWSMVVLAAGAVLAIISLVFWRLATAKAAKKAQRMAQPSR